MPPPMFPQPGPPAPAAPPTGNPGEMAAAMAQVRQAISILEMTLPKLAIGSEQHKACIDALKTLTKAYPVTDEVPGLQSTALMGMMRNSRQGAVMQQLMRQQAGGEGGGGPPGGAAPPMMGAGAPAGPM